MIDQVTKKHIAKFIPESAYLPEIIQLVSDLMIVFELTFQEVVDYLNEHSQLDLKWFNKFSGQLNVLCLGEGKPFEIGNICVMIPNELTNYKDQLTIDWENKLLLYNPDSLPKELMRFFIKKSQVYRKPKISDGPISINITPLVIEDGESAILYFNNYFHYSSMIDQLTL